MERKFQFQCTAFSIEINLIIWKACSCLYRLLSPCWVWVVTTNIFSILFLFFTVPSRVHMLYCFISRWVSVSIGLFGWFKRLRSVKPRWRLANQKQKTKISQLWAIAWIKDTHSCPTSERHLNCQLHDHVLISRQCTVTTLLINVIMLRSGIL